MISNVTNLRRSLFQYEWLLDYSNYLRLIYGISSRIFKLQIDGNDSNSTLIFREWISPNIWPLLASFSQNYVSSINCVLNFVLYSLTNDNWVTKIFRMISTNSLGIITSRKALRVNLGRHNTNLISCFKLPYSWSMNRPKLVNTRNWFWTWVPLDWKK